jgi:hypothetical protein
MLKSLSDSQRALLKIAGVAALALAICVVPVMLSRRLASTTQSSAAASIDAYRGLGCWVSIYDRRAWSDPEAAVADMAGHGVRTLFIQTGNSNSKGVVYNPPAQERFISAAHARGMKIVAWYLPEMVDLSYDYDRIAQAIALRTSDGQSFDSFALDIESTAIKDTTARAQALAALTVRLRRLVGSSYALGGIVPSPVGIEKQTGFWDDFPYEAVAKDYDVLLPMEYYTYHGKGAKAATADVASSLRILRALPGCATVPVHLIGGLAAKSKGVEVGAFAAQSKANGCVGASLYSWSGITPAEWDALQVLVH